MRTILIGDIHGCFDQLGQLLAQLSFDEAHDRLILLGDLMDRGKDSCRVYHRAAELQRKMGSRFVLLRGSHEKLLLEDSPRLRDKLLWRLVGKGAAVASFRRRGEKMEDSIPWFREHSLLYYEDALFQCVHAGIRHENPAENDEHTLLMDHGIARKNAYAGKLTITGHIHLMEPTWFDGSGGKGHILPYGEWLPLPEKGVICLDTGCAEGNKLTAMVVSDGRYRLHCVKRRK